MFTKSAQYYDLIYSSLKDYPGEAGKIASLIQKINSSALTILDVACGTAEHARLLNENYNYQVNGIDLNEDFLEVARRKLPKAKFETADMTNFRLGQQYDVVMCLFSSIGYVQSLENVRKTLGCFKNHLSPGGLIIVEPWLTPDAWKAGQIDIRTVELENLKICRMGLSNLEGTISKLRFEYLIGTTEEIRHEMEDHELGLFTVEEMVQCFEEAGLESSYDPEGIFGRGLYVARGKTT
jgi:ubiquinone/menaquinone biosynthesis C-methylase UbiE